MIKMASIPRFFFRGHSEMEFLLKNHLSPVWSAKEQLQNRQMKEKREMLVFSLSLSLSH